MILINLLPHREAARKRQKEIFQTIMFLSALAGIFLAFLVYGLMQMRLEIQQERNAFLRSEIEVLNKQIQEVAGLEGEIKALIERQKAVETLQANRNLPVHFLNELVRVMPEGVYLSSIQQKELQVELKGVAQSNERVSGILRNISKKAPWFEKPVLKEIVASTVDLSPRDKRQVVKFIIDFSLVLPEISAEAVGRQSDDVNGKKQVAINSVVVESSE